MKNIILSASLLIATFASAQKSIPAGTTPAPTPFTERSAGQKTKVQSAERSVVGDLEFRNIGPSIMSGRVVDIDVNPNDPTHFYVAYASGGVWFTDNNGTSFTPVFDNMDAINIGDIAVDWNAKPQPVIWVGTGESNSSRSSYAGNGVYKSVDGGKKWQHMGLGESHHIGQVLISREDPNTVYVAVIGHLFSFNPDRGLYKTTDGGVTWKHVLFIDNATGVIDVIQDPQNSKKIYAIAWHRERVLWNFVEGGKTSGIYVSENAGENFTLLTTAGSGFPQGEGVGRIGLTVFPGNTNVMYAIVDNQSIVPDTTGKRQEKLYPSDFRKMTKEEFAKLDEHKLKDYLKRNRFPEEHTVASVKEDVKNGKYLPVALADYVADANSDLFSVPIIGAEVWQSLDGGKSWKKKSDKSIGSLFYTYGYYFGKIWISPFDQNEVYIAGVGLMKSHDGGKSFNAIDGDNQHGDHHALWLNPSRRGHIINGNDGGMNISWDSGKHWIKCNTPAVGQFYGINVDRAEPYNVYGGLQDNGVWTGPSTYSASTAWHGEGQYPWKFLLGGDGMQVMVDTRDNNTVYTGYQFGHYYRIDKSTGKEEYVRPRMKLGDKPLRFSWQTPIWLSQHNQDILYMGAQRLFRSMDQGRTFEAISDDLTRGAKTGDVPYGCLSTINESVLKFGLIYTGSDDGLIHVTKDGGATWTRVSDKLPQNMRISRVVASSHVEGRVYATLSGCQWDHFTAYVYVSEDYGATWKQIFTDLPAEAANVVREDPVNPDLLFCGTDNGLYVSLDRGKTSMIMNNNLPAVAIHDLVIQPDAHDLVVGTHGRSIYIVNIEALEQLDASKMQQPLYVYEPEQAKLQMVYEIVNDDYYPFRMANVPLAYYAQQGGKSTIEIFTMNDVKLSTISDSAYKGLNTLNVPMIVDSVNAENYKNYLSENDIEEKPEEYREGKLLALAGKYKMVVTDAKGNKVMREVVVRK
jgi:photosystem II stability/assembly factor-like uncharacterized protein